MFRQIVDRLMTDQVLPFAALLAYAGALWVGWRGSLRPALLVNLLSGAAVLAYNIPAINTDPPFLLFIAFEAVVLLTAALALCGVAVPRWITWGAFAINLILWVALIAFLLTFKMRMF